MAGATVALAAAPVEVAAVWGVPLLLEVAADSAAAADIAAAEVLAADSVVVRIDRAEDLLRLLLITIITTMAAAAAIITEADIAEAA